MIRYKAKYTTPGPKLKGWNHGSKFIDKKKLKLFDKTYSNFLDAELDLDLNEANLEYADEMKPKKEGK